MFSNKAILFMVLIPLLQAVNVRAGINDDLKEFVKRLKKWMPYMDCLDSDFPVMEPLFIENLDFDVDHEIGKLKGSFQNTVIRNLSTVEVNLINVVPILQTFKAKVSIPELFINGEYIIDGDIGDLIPLTGEGPVEIILVNVTVAVDGKLSIFPLGIKDVNINFNISNFQGHFHGLLGEAELEEVFNKVINEIALEALDVLWPGLEVVLAQKLKEEAAKMLKDMTLADLLNLMNDIKTALPLDELENCKNKTDFPQSYDLL